MVKKITNKSFKYEAIEEDTLKNGIENFKRSIIILHFTKVLSTK